MTRRDGRPSRNRFLAYSAPFSRTDTVSGHLMEIADNAAHRGPFFLAEQRSTTVPQHVATDRYLPSRAESFSGWPRDSALPTSR